MLQYSPKIVTDSLVMCLDASQNKSYPAADLPIKDRLNLWLDAADDTTFSYSSGTTISQWRDKSGQNNHAIVNGGSPVRSVAINSRKAVSFTSTSWFKCTTGTFASNATHFLVCRATTSSATYQRVYNGGSDGYLFFGALANNIATFWGTLSSGWIDTNVNSPSITILNTLRIISAINNGSTGTPYYDGTAMSTKTTTNSFAYTGYELNSYSNGVISQPLIGEVCEIIVFNKQLSATELKQVHTYLGQKWGISNTDRIAINLAGGFTNPWLLGVGDGATNNMPTYSPYNKTFVFDGTNDIISYPNALGTFGSYTFSFWARRNVENKMALSSYGNAAFYWFGDNSWAYTHGGVFGEKYYNKAVSIPLGSYGHYCVTYDGAAVRIYRNGVFEDSQATTGSAVFNVGLQLGRYGADAVNYAFSGDIANFLMYTRALSAAEVQQNYESQKSRFANYIVTSGLVLNLDAGNPYSYAGAGSTWYDVSGNTKDFLIDGSGITYNSGGYFTLADGGITRSATITNSITCTVVVWIRTTDTQSLIFKGNNLSDYYLAAYYVGQGFYNNNCGSPTYWIDTNSVSNPNPTYLDGNWHMWEMKNVNFSSWTSYEFNKYSGFTFGNGAVGQIMIYDRNLSSAESLQIYNATKGRFGL